MTATAEHTLLPKQDELVFSTERHTVYSGAVGAGKSRALCVAAVLHVAGKPHARFGLFRKTLVGLKKSTLKTLLEGDGKAPPVLPRGSYTHNKNDAEIRVNGGGSILYSGVETPEAVRSMNLSQAGVDEVTELMADDYNAIDDRVRLDIGEPLRILSATNPGTPSHWMARMMGLSPDKQAPDPDCKIILTKTSDNTFLPASYIQSFARHEGTVYYRRMFLGEWCGSEGMVYDKFMRPVHVRERKGIAKTRIIGVDEGYSDPFVALDIHIDSDNRAHVAREVYEVKLVGPEKVDIVKAMAADDAVVVVDSAAPDLIDLFRRSGIDAVPATKGPGSIEYGIGLVQTRLATDDRGEPSLTVDPCCTNTIREFETYEWARSREGLKDKPADRDNHAMDALRYAIRYRDGSRVAMPTGVTVDDEWDEDRMWEAL